MSDPETAFLDALRDRPADDTARLAFADWLDKHDRPTEAEYLRLVCEHRRVSRRLGEVRAGLSRAWTASVSPWCRVVLVRTRSDSMSTVIKLIREVSGLGLVDAVRVAETAPSVIRGGLSLDAALAVANGFESVAEVCVEADPRA